MTKKKPVRKPRAIASRIASRKVIKRAGRASSFSKKNAGKAIFSPAPPRNLKVQVAGKGLAKQWAIKSYDKGRGKIPKNVKALIKKVRSYRKKSSGKRGAFTKAYNLRVDKEMRGYGYTPEQVRRSRNFRASGKVLFEKFKGLQVEGKKYKTYKVHKRVKIRKHGKVVRTRLEWVTRKKITHYKVNRRWIPAGNFKKKIASLKYHALVRYYQNLYGISYKEAGALYRGLRDENWGQKIFAALY